MAESSGVNGVCVLCMCERVSLGEANAVRVGRLPQGGGQWGQRCMYVCVCVCEESV
jgi:hypothetical protein